MHAYVIEVTPENLRGVIRSEAGKSFDLDLALAWLDEHGEGWFLRDEGSALDCQFFVPEVLFEMYVFTSHDESELLRQVVKI